MKNYMMATGFALSSTLFLASAKSETLDDGSYQVTRKDLGQGDLIDIVNEKSSPVRNDSPSSVGGANWQVVSGTGKSIVSIKMSPKFGSLGTSLILSAPLEKNSPSSRFNNSNELVNDFNASINFSYVHYSKNNLGKIEPIEIASLYELCDSKRSEFIGLDKKKKCKDFEIPELAKAYKGSEIAGISAIKSFNSWADKSYWVFGTSFTAGYDEFEFFQGDSMEKEEQTESAWSAGLSASYHLPKISLITLKSEYQHFYKPASTTIRCPSLTTTTTVNCLSSAGGNPGKIERTVTTIESRFLTKRIPSVKGVSPKISYNDDNHKIQVDIPVFLLNDGKGGYNGGINSRWDSLSDSWEFSVFVGAKFPGF